MASLVRGAGRPAGPISRRDYSAEKEEVFHVEKLEANVFRRVSESRRVPREGLQVRTVTVEERVLRDGDRPKLVAELKGSDQAWVLNTTNCELLEELTGSEESETTGAATASSSTTTGACVGRRRERRRACSCRLRAPVRQHSDGCGHRRSRRRVTAASHPGSGGIRSRGLLYAHQQYKHHG